MDPEGVFRYIDLFFHVSGHAPPHEKLCAQSGEGPGHYAPQKEHRQINDKSHRPCDGDGRRHLTYIMSHRANNAAQPYLIFGHAAMEQQGHKIAQHAARQTVYHRHHLPRKYASEKYPAKQYP